MANDQTNVPDSDNQSDLETASTPDTEQKQTDSAPVADTDQQTITETEEKGPEFDDKNMQSRFTQRMTELKQKENELGEKLTQHEQKVRAWDTLVTMPEFKQWYQTYQSKGESPVPDISDQEWIEATSDKMKFQELLDKRAETIGRRLLEPEVTSLRQEWETEKFANEITNFADATNESGQSLHGDFWKLDEAGKIEPYLKAFQGIKMPGMAKIEWAYKLARYDTREQEAISKAHKTVQDKISASGEKGVSHELSTKPAGKMPGETSEERMKNFARQYAKKKGMELP